jgi:oligopeptide transport system ATP-binding protein
MHLLSISDLVVRFRTHDGTVHAVNGVSLDLDEGETLGLVGESGCGKSVTNLALMRLLPQPAGHIEGGEIVFEGQNLLELDESAMRDLRGKDVAMIFQDPMTSLNPVLRIEEQMVETIRAHRKVSRKDARARAVEPTTALDVTIQAQVLDLLAHLAAERNTAVILITHDLGVVAGMTKRINVMYAGFVVEAAATPDLFARPRHPYTVGLLHSMPRLDAQPGEPLIPIEGAPPDLRTAPKGCPFAPRCAWALDKCWLEMPALDPIDPSASVTTTGPGVTHRVACWNIPTPDEAKLAQPDRPGFVAAPPPAAALEVAR